MPINWQPIEIAPRTQRVLLYFPPLHSASAFIIGGYYNHHQYAAAPRPYWDHDMAHLWGMRETRRRQPTMWADMRVLLEEAAEQQEGGKV